MGFAIVPEYPKLGGHECERNKIFLWPNHPVLDRHFSAIAASPSLAGGEKKPWWLSNRKREELTIQEVWWWSSVEEDREGVDFIWIGDEALMESTQALILAPPLISRFFKSFFLEIVMYSPGANGGFCAAVVNREDAFETATVIAMLMAAACVSDTITFCFVISRILWRF